MMIVEIAVQPVILNGQMRVQKGVECRLKVMAIVNAYGGATKSDTLYMQSV